jgi:hypothetical protein
MSAYVRSVGSFNPIALPAPRSFSPQFFRNSIHIANRRNLGTMAQTFNQLPEELQLATSAHVKYIQSLDSRKDEYDYWLTEHLRLNGLYWGLTALHLLGHPDALPRAETIDFVLSCQHESGGFGAAPGHDAHMLSTVSAVQILATIDAFDELETRGKGKAQVGKCASPGAVDLQKQGFFMLTVPWVQILPVSKIARPARSLATSGEKKTPGSSTAPSTPCPSWDSCISSTWTRRSITSRRAPTSTAGMESALAPSPTPGRSSPASRP